MKVPADAIIASEKLTGYLLLPRPQNDKSKFLAQVGFTPANPETLIAAIRQHTQSFEAIEDGVNDYGTFYRVEGIIAGPNGKRATVVTIWIRWHLDGRFRFVTLKPK